MILQMIPVQLIPSQHFERYRLSLDNANSGMRGCKRPGGLGERRKVCVVCLGDAGGPGP